MSFCSKFLKIKLLSHFSQRHQFSFLSFLFQNITWPYCLIHSLAFGKRRFHFSPNCRTSQFTSRKFFKEKTHLRNSWFLNLLGPFSSLQGMHDFMTVVLALPIGQNQWKCWTIFRTQSFFGIWEYHPLEMVVGFISSTLNFDIWETPRDELPKQS